MRRLYLQIYLAIVAVILLFGILTAAAWFYLPLSPHERETLDGVATLAGEILPPASRSAAELHAALARLGKMFSADLAVRGADGAVIASVGRPVPAPDPAWSDSQWIKDPTGPPAVALHLPDGRWLVARYSRHDHGIGWLIVLGLLGVTVAAGAYPVARRITRRLERLRARVDELGAGQLSARVGIEGRDEVADLARSFNRAADRIERLVNAQRTMLAGASHELRSPLARMRVAVELLAGDQRPELRRQLSEDIAELDELIGELLLASRLDTAGGVEHREEVDLLALLAEESARSGGEVGGVPVRIRGDRYMLRILVRNLLQNARRHGAGSAVESSVGVEDGAARLCVADRGPGVPSGERERIFEPFYRPAGMRESAEGGVGLGLALVRQIARLHGGEARCLERPGGGTLFEVTLGRSLP